MPKQLNYPRATLKNALGLADAVNALGGDCNAGTCADKLNYKGGHKNGAFTALTSATVKHGLITSKSETLSVTDLYSQINLSYTDAERQEHLQTAFLAPPLYRRIYEKFKGKELPVDILERMLIREYEVDQGSASRIAGYIIDGSRYVGLLVDNRFVEHVKAQEAVVIEPEQEQVTKMESDQTTPSGDAVNPDVPQPTPGVTDKGEFNEAGYRFTIVGPDMNATYKLQDEDDFAIIDITLRKVKRRLGMD